MVSPLGPLGACVVLLCLGLVTTQNDEECGIWNGENGAPWYVWIYRKDAGGKYSNRCYGTLVAPDVAMRGVRYCGLGSYPAADFLVASGEVNEDGTLVNRGYQLSKVKKTFAHPMYNASGQLENNVALAQLETPFRSTSSTRPVCLQLWDENTYANMLRTGTEGRGYTQLQQDPVTVLSKGQCRRQVGGSLTPDVFCVSNVGSCPAGVVFPVADSNGVERWHLAGIISVCHNMTNVLPSLYRLREWIKSTSLLPQKPQVRGCPLPEQPRNGEYSVEGRSGAPVPGEMVPDFTILTYRCNAGHSPQSEVAYCRSDYTWSRNPVCTQDTAIKCPLPESLTVEASCWRDNNKRIPCSNAVEAGTIVRFQCKPWHREVEHHVYQLSCSEVSGRFDYSVPKCVPECGVVPSDAAILVAGGQTARRSAFPWHVAIYKKFGSAAAEDYEQICGGNLIRTHLVISAAHCFYVSQLRRTESPDNFAVAVGKFYRSWSHQEDNTNKFIQKSKVKNIFIPEEYSGLIQQYQSDMAILELTTPVVLSEAVQPVCLDFNYNLNGLQLSPGNLGKVAGWGLTSEGESSDTLQSLNVPYISYRDCYNEMIKYDFVKFLLRDKFCAGYTNGSAVCKGDSGGGLVFPYQEPSVERWYLRGLVSVGPLDPRGSCRKETYSAYTEVYSLKDWLQNLFRRLNV